MAAAGIPVLLHLTGRAKPVTHKFPAMRFILKSQKSSTRALRIKHLLILLLRMLALAMLVFTLARPLTGTGVISAAWGVSGLLIAVLTGVSLFRREYILAAVGIVALAALQQSYPEDSPGSRQSVRGDFVLVLDRSLSMGFQEPDGTRFDLAKKQALDLLDRLAPEARVALVFADQTAERVQGRLTYRHDAVREKLRQAGVGGGALNLGRALSTAQEIFARERAEKNAQSFVILFTDLQRNAIRTLLTEKRDAREKESVPTLVVDVGGSDARNGAALSVSLPGDTLPAESTVALNGKLRPADKDRRCLVELYLDDRRIEQKLVEPGGKDIVDVEFQLATGAPGPHSGRLHLADSDRLALDQDFHFVYTSGRPAKALILDSPNGSKGKRTSFFLQAALRPGMGDSALNLSGLDVSVEAAQELTKAKLAAYKALILADCGDLSDASWGALQQWVEDGGGLFVWMGPNTNPAVVARYGFQEFAKNRGLIPGTVGALQTPEKPLAVVMAQPEHPVLAHFTPGVAAVLRETQVSKYVKIASDARDANAAVVLGLGDGSPLLLEKTYGRGRVLLCALDPGLEFSDLPRRAEAFVTLVLDGLRLLSGQDTELKGRLGQPLVLPVPNVPADRTLYWRAPGNAQAVALRVETPADEKKRSPEQAAVAPTAIVPPLEAIGVHRFTWTPAGAKAPLVRLVEVNVDSSESDLAKASAEDAKKALAPWQPAFAKNLSEARGLGDGAGSTVQREFTPLLLLVLMMLLLSESFLSNRLYRGGEGESNVGEGVN